MPFGGHLCAAGPNPWLIIFLGKWMHEGFHEWVIGAFIRGPAFEGNKWGDYRILVWEDPDKGIYLCRRESAGGRAQAGRDADCRRTQAGRAGAESARIAPQGNSNSEPRNSSTQKPWEHLHVWQPVHTFIQLLAKLFTLALYWLLLFKRGYHRVWHSMVAQWLLRTRLGMVRTAWL